MPRVDAHAHLVPTRYRREIEAAGAFAPPPAGPVEISAMMERYEIDAAIISSGPPGVNLGGATSSAETARILNQELAEIVVAEPARFAALAALPLPGIDEALAELAYCLDELALDGVALLSNENGVYVGDPSLDPLMAELDRRGAYVFVHPTAPPYAAPLDHPEWLYEFPFETTRVITNLIYSGALDRFPRIRWQFPHLGGTVPFLAHRLASLAERDPRGTAEVELGAIEYLRRLYYDTGLSNYELPGRPTVELAGNAASTLTRYARMS